MARMSLSARRGSLVRLAIALSSSQKALMLQRNRQRTRRKKNTGKFMRFREQVL